jgi:hypothetical protein
VHGSDSSQVLADVDSLSGCPRCQFTRLVLSQFVPSQVLNPQPGLPGSPAAGQAPIHLAPEQLMTILHPAPGRVVNLLQFAWPLPQLPVSTPSVPATPPNTADSSPRPSSAGDASVTAAQPCSTTSPTSLSALGAASPHTGADTPLQGSVTLSDSLLGDDRLLRQFLLQGLAGLQQVSHMGGACVGHRDCPGPDDLQVVEEKLQRQHDALVEQLQVGEDTAQVPARAYVSPLNSTLNSLEACRSAVACVGPIP